MLTAGLEHVEHSQDDLRFGEIDIFLRPADKKLFFTKEFRSRSVAEHSLRQIQAEERSRLAHPCLLPLLDYSADAQSLRLVCKFAYPSSDLGETPEAVSAPEGQLRYLFDLLDVTSYLNAAALSHGDVRPEHIFFDEEKRNFVLVDRLADPLTASRHLKNVMKAEYNLYCAPEVFEAVDSGSFDAAKAESFSIGMSLLEVISGVGTLQKFYNTKEQRFLTNEFKEFLQNLKKNYVYINYEPLGKFIADKLLNPNVSERLSPEEALLDLYDEYKAELDKERNPPLPLPTSSLQIQNYDNYKEKNSLVTDETRSLLTEGNKVYKRTDSHEKQSDVQTIGRDPPEDQSKIEPYQSKPGDAIANDDKLLIQYLAQELFNKGYRVVPIDGGESNANPPLISPPIVEMVRQRLSEYTMQDFTALNFKIVNLDPSDSAKFIDTSIKVKPEEGFEQPENPGFIPNISDSAKFIDNTVQIFDNGLNLPLAPEDSNSIPISDSLKFIDNSVALNIPISSEEAPPPFKEELPDSAKFIDIAKPLPVDPLPNPSNITDENDGFLPDSAKFIDRAMPVATPEFSNPSDDADLLLPLDLTDSTRFIDNSVPQYNQIQPNTKDNQALDPSDSLKFIDTSVAINDAAFDIPHESEELFLPLPDSSKFIDTSVPVPAQPDNMLQSDQLLPSDSFKFIDTSIPITTPTIKDINQAGFKIVPEDQGNDLVLPLSFLPDSSKFIDTSVPIPDHAIPVMINNGLKILPPESISELNGDSSKDDATTTDTAKKPVNNKLTDEEAQLLALETLLKAGYQINKSNKDYMLLTNPNKMIDPSLLKLFPKKPVDLSESSMKTIIVNKPIKKKTVNDMVTSTKSLEQANLIKKGPLQIQKIGPFAKQIIKVHKNPLEVGNQKNFIKQNKPQIIEAGIATDEIPKKDSSAHALELSGSNYAVRTSNTPLDPYNSISPFHLNPYEQSDNIHINQPENTSHHVHSESAKSLTDGFVQENEDFFKKIDTQIEASNRILLNTKLSLKPTQPIVLEEPSVRNSEISKPTNIHSCKSKHKVEQRTQLELSELPQAKAVYVPGFTSISFCNDGVNVQTVRIPEGGRVKIVAPILRVEGSAEKTNNAITPESAVEASKSIGQTSTVYSSNIRTYKKRSNRDIFIQPSSNEVSTSIIIPRDEPFLTTSQNAASSSQSSSNTPPATFRSSYFQPAPPLSINKFGDTQRPNFSKTDNNRLTVLKTESVVLAEQGSVGKPTSQKITKSSVFIDCNFSKK